MLNLVVVAVCVTGCCEVERYVLTIIKMMIIIIIIISTVVSVRWMPAGVWHQSLFTIIGHVNILLCSKPRLIWLKGV